MVHDMSRPGTDEEILGIIESQAYRRWTIAGYRYWDLQLNPSDQMLLGRSYAWLRNRHIDRMSMSDLGKAELEELIFTVLPAFAGAVKRIWPVTNVNFEWLGNSTDHHRGHGHAHLIPRLSRSVEFMGHMFMDAEPQKRRPAGRLELDDEVLEQIRYVIKAELER
ncbi:MAG: hypothetical protein V4681_00615 [Patescibacteria group bacterium]